MIGYINNGNCNRIYKGDTIINKIYKGDKLIFGDSLLWSYKAGDGVPSNSVGVTETENGLYFDGSSYFTYDITTNATTISFDYYCLQPNTSYPTPISEILGRGIYVHFVYNSTFKLGYGYKSMTEFNTKEKVVYNEWHNIKIEVRGGKINLYHDDSLIASKDYSYPLKGKSFAFGCAMWGNNPECYYTGYINNIKIEEI